MENKETVLRIEVERTSFNFTKVIVTAGEWNRENGRALSHPNENLREVRLALYITEHGVKDKQRILEDTGEICTGTVYNANINKLEAVLRHMKKLQTQLNNMSVNFGKPNGFAGQVKRLAKATKSRFLCHDQLTMAASGFYAKIWESKDIEWYVNEIILEEIENIKGTQAVSA